MPDIGLIVIADSDPGEPDVLLSPLTYSWRHEAELEIRFAHADQAMRIAGLDAIVRALGQTFATDDTLGDAVDYAELTAPETEEDAFDGGVPERSARLEAVLYYDSPTPAG